MLIFLLTEPKLPIVGGDLSVRLVVEHDDDRTSNVSVKAIHVLEADAVELTLK